MVCHLHILICTEKSDLHCNLNTNKRFALTQKQLNVEAILFVFVYEHVLKNVSVYESMIYMVHRISEAVLNTSLSNSPESQNTAYCKMYVHCIRPESRYNSVLQVDRLWVEIE